MLSNYSYRNQKFDSFLVMVYNLFRCSQRMCLDSLVGCYGLRDVMKCAETIDWNGLTRIAVRVHRRRWNKKWWDGGGRRYTHIRTPGKRWKVSARKSVSVIMQKLQSERAGAALKMGEWEKFAATSIINFKLKKFYIENYYKRIAGVPNRGGEAGTDVQSSLERILLFSVENENLCPWNSR